MKKYFSTFILVLFLVACTPKNDGRYVYDNPVQNEFVDLTLDKNSRSILSLDKPVGNHNSKRNIINFMDDEKVFINWQGTIVLIDSTATGDNSFFCTDFPDSVDYISLRNRLKKERLHLVKDRLLKRIEDGGSTSKVKSDEVSLANVNDLLQDSSLYFERIVTLIKIPLNPKKDVVFTCGFYIHKDHPICKKIKQLKAGDKVYFDGFLKKEDGCINIGSAISSDEYFKTHTLSPNLNFNFCLLNIDTQKQSDNLPTKLQKLTDADFAQFKQLKEKPIKSKNELVQYVEIYKRQSETQENSLSTEQKAYRHRLLEGLSEEYLNNMK